MDLYRGKTVKTGDWIIGAAVCMGDKAYILGSENLFPERPAYSRMMLKYDVVNARIKDPAQGAEFGWRTALEKYEENFPIWLEIRPETLTRCCDKHDTSGNVLFEGDVIRNPYNALLEICYGKYQAWCPADQEYMENVGFFAISKGVPEDRGIEQPMPLGYTEEYAYLVGNIFDSPELSQAAPDGSQEAGQQALKPAT